MAVLFLLLAVLCLVVLGAAELGATIRQRQRATGRSFGQLTEGQLIVAAGLGFLVALFLFLAFGASNPPHPAQGAQVPPPRRRGRVDELRPPAAGAVLHPRRARPGRAQPFRRRRRARPRRSHRRQRPRRRHGGSHRRQRRPRPRP